MQCEARAEAKVAPEPARKQALPELQQRLNPDPGPVLLRVRLVTDPEAIGLEWKAEAIFKICSNGCPLSRWPR